MTTNTTNAKTLIIRNLTPDVNRALRWGKRRFRQATNSRAAERMLLRCREQEECIKQLELEKKSLERRYGKLLRAARRLALWNNPGSVDAIPQGWPSCRENWSWRKAA